MSGPKGKHHFLHLFSWQRERGRVIPVKTPEELSKKSDILSYRLETAKIAESIDANIKLTELMIKELSSSDSKKIQNKEIQKEIEELQKMVEDIKRKVADLKIGEAIKQVATATMKRNVEDPATIKKVKDSMDKINEMVDYLISIKPLTQRQNFADRSSENRMAMLKNMKANVTSIAKTCRDRLNRLINRKGKKYSTPKQ